MTHPPGPHTSTGCVPPEVTPASGSGGGRSTQIEPRQVPDAGPPSAVPGRPPSSMLASPDGLWTTCTQTLPRQKVGFALTPPSPSDTGTVTVQIGPRHVAPGGTPPSARRRTRQ